MNLSKLWETVCENAEFLLVVLAVAAVLMLLAVGFETAFAKGRERPRLTLRIVTVGMMSALAFIVQFFEFPLLFLAPNFYKLDFSEVPVLISAFSMGPVAGVLTELLKNVLKILLRGTSTAFVGDFANFVVGCSLILPASMIYYRKKTKKRALIGCAAGTVTIVLFGSLFNAWYLLPAFSKLYGMDLDAIVEMGHAIFSGVKDFGIYQFVFFCVAPINLIKGAAVSTIVILIYKPVRRVMNSLFS